MLGGDGGQGVAGVVGGMSWRERGQKGYASADWHISAEHDGEVGSLGR